MGRLTRIIAFVLCFVMVFTVTGFAVSVVSPVANSVVYTDSLLVSVKVTEKVTVKVTVYEEKIKSGDEYVSADVSKLTSDDLALIAGYRTASSDTEAPVLSDGTKAKKYSDVVFANTVSYTNTADVGFYTKQLNNVNPGLYRVSVNTMGENDKVVSTVSSLVAVKQKAEEKKNNIFQAQTTTALQFIQNLLKKVFK